MANNVIFTDGFDHYTTIGDKWDAVLIGTGAGPTIVAGAGRGGAGALNMPVQPLGLGWSLNAVQKNVGAQNTIYVGFALSWNPSTQNGDLPIFSVWDGSTCQVALMITVSGTMYFTRNILGSSPVNIGSPTSVAFPSTSYHYVEVSITIGTGTSGSCTLKWDQATVLTISGVNTSASTSSILSNLMLGNPTPGSIKPPALYYDDVYIDTLGFNGDNRINGQLPTGNGTQNDWTSNILGWVASTVEAIGYTILDSNGNYQRVVAVTSDAKTGTGVPTWATTVGVNTTDNHVTWTCLGAASQYKIVNEPNPDGDNSYISSNTVNQISRYTYPSISGSSIKSVIVWPFGRKDDGGYRTIRAASKYAGTAGTSSTDVALGGQYQYQPCILATDPSGNPWTAASVNATEFGVTLTN